MVISDDEDNQTLVKGRKPRAVDYIAVQKFSKMKEDVNSFDVLMGETADNFCSNKGQGMPIFYKTK